jgi:hypothetical protein
MRWSNLCAQAATTSIEPLALRDLVASLYAYLARPALGAELIDADQFGAAIEDRIAQLHRALAACFAQGIGWPSLNNNGAVDGRFLDIEVSVNLCAPLLGQIRSVDGRSFGLAHGFEFVIVVAELRNALAAVAAQFHRIAAAASDARVRHIARHFFRLIDVHVRRAACWSARSTGAQVRRILQPSGLPEDQVARIARRLVAYERTDAIRRFPVRMERLPVALARVEPWFTPAVHVPAASAVDAGTLADIAFFQRMLAWVDEQSEAQDYIDALRAARERILARFATARRCAAVPARACGTTDR